VFAWDAAWRRLGALAAEALAPLAERDAPAYTERPGAARHDPTMTDNHEAPNVRDLLHRIEQQIAELATARKRRVHSTKSAAEYCGMNYGTFRNRAASGTGPLQHKDGDSNGFYESDLDAWNEARLLPVPRIYPADSTI